MKILSFLVVLQLTLFSAEKDELPKGFKSPQDKASYEKVLKEHEFAVIATSVSLCNTCPSAAERTKRCEKFLKTLARELSEEVGLFYWTGNEYKKMQTIIGAKPARAILYQNAHYIVSCVLISSEDQSVLLEGELGKYKNYSRKEDKQSFENFITAFNEIKTVEVAQENKVLKVISKRNKTIELLPLSIKGEILRYEFEGGTYQIDLKKLTDESVLKIKESLN